MITTCHNVHLPRLSDLPAIGVLPARDVAQQRKQQDTRRPEATNPRSCE